jgi:hypothetical protein
MEYFAESEVCEAENACTLTCYRSSLCVAAKFSIQVIEYDCKQGLLSRNLKSVVRHGTGTCKVVSLLPKRRLFSVTSLLLAKMSSSSVPTVADFAEWTFERSSWLCLEGPTNGTAFPENSKLRHENSTEVHPHAVAVSATLVTCEKVFDSISFIHC